MKLTVKQRLVLLQILPKEASFTDIKILDRLGHALTLSEREMTDIGFEIKDGLMHWDDTKEKPTDIEIGPRAVSILNEKLKQLDKQNKITVDMVPLYEMFVNDEV